MGKEFHFNSLDIVQGDDLPITERDKVWVWNLSCLSKAVQEYVPPSVFLLIFLIESVPLGYTFCRWLDGNRILSKIENKGCF